MRAFDFTRPGLETRDAPAWEVDALTTRQPDALSAKFCGTLFRVELYSKRVCHSVSPQSRRSGKFCSGGFHMQCGRSQIETAPWRRAAPGPAPSNQRPLGASRPSNMYGDSSTRCVWFTSYQHLRSYQDMYRLLTVHTHGDFIVLAQFCKFHYQSTFTVIGRNHGRVVFIAFPLWMAIVQNVTQLACDLW